MAETLEPVATLQNLQELRLLSCKVLSGGLRPIARCRSLRELDLHYQFPIDDYVYLSVALPHVICEKFRPWVAFDFEEGDRMMVGKGRGLLHSVKDKHKIERYERQWVELQTKYRAELGR